MTRGDYSLPMASHTFLAEPSPTGRRFRPRLSTRRLAIVRRSRRFRREKLPAAISYSAVGFLVHDACGMDCQPATARAGRRGSRRHAGGAAARSLEVLRAKCARCQPGGKRRSEAAVARARSGLLRTACPGVADRFAGIGIPGQISTDAGSLWKDQVESACRVRWPAVLDL